MNSFSGTTGVKNNDGKSVSECQEWFWVMNWVFSDFDGIRGNLQLKDSVMIVMLFFRIGSWDNSDMLLA
jgi:hypothetical protein